MQNYSIIFADAESCDDILVIKKVKPPCQFGRYNLPGGKIKDGENSIEAALRELKEETGLTLEKGLQARQMGKIKGTWGTVESFGC